MSTRGVDGSQPFIPTQALAVYKPSFLAVQAQTLPAQPPEENAAGALPPFIGKGLIVDTYA